MSLHNSITGHNRSGLIISPRVNKLPVKPPRCDWSASVGVSAAGAQLGDESASSVTSPAARMPYMLVSTQIRLVRIRDALLYSVRERSKRCGATAHARAERPPAT